VVPGRYIQIMKSTWCTLSIKGILDFCVVYTLSWIKL
jgi:hypothetical protein